MGTGPYWAGIVVSKLPGQQLGAEPAEPELRLEREP